MRWLVVPFGRGEWTGCFVQRDGNASYLGRLAVWSGGVCGRLMWPFWDVGELIGVVGDLAVLLIPRSVALFFKILFMSESNLLQMLGRSRISYHF